MTLPLTEDEDHPRRASDIMRALAGPKIETAKDGAEEGGAEGSGETEQPAGEAAADRISIGTLVDALSDRAFGILMLILALPCCLPFLYGVPQVVSVPMMFIAAQLAVGRRTLWLPGSLRRRTISRASFQDIERRARPYLRRLERMAKPSLTALTARGFEWFWGLVMLICSISIALPFPLTNTTPGIGVAIMAIGFIEKDGRLILLGAVIGLAWVAMLILLGDQLISLLKSLLGL